MKTAALSFVFLLALIIMYGFKKLSARQIVLNRDHISGKVPFYAELVGVSKYGNSICYYMFPVGPNCCRDLRTDSITYHE